MVTWQMSRRCPSSPPSGRHGAYDMRRENPEVNLDLQLVVVRRLVSCGENLENVFYYTPATVAGEDRQETMYRENLDDRCLDLRAYAPHGASRKNT